ncbi:MAG: hypothetical protein ACYTGL_21570 [Planctomycetota bacterium]|jgi:hypothetical protein
MKIPTCLLGAVIVTQAAIMSAFAQLEFENEPINYHTTPAHDRIAQLITAIEKGEAELTWDETHGWLPSILEAMEVPRSSQTLVFSKTSLQLSRINTHRPRALYYNDDTYVGWVQRGDVVELAAVDPVQGTIFYTLKQTNHQPPDIRRDRGNCLVCHASTRTKGVPGLLVRSVFPSENGQPHFGLGTITTDHSTPFEKRFGGWYVTGTHGDMRHRGNAIAEDSVDNPIDPEPGANLAVLDDLIRTQPYLEPGSDLVALMLLEYQSQMHNVLTRASFETRRALHYDSVMNEALDRPADFRSDVTQRRIKSEGERLLKFLFYCDEFVLKSPVNGTSAFVRDFETLGPRDKDGRSLRDFDLQTRLFRYPLSYLIYSESFDALPDAVRSYVETRMAEILSGRDESADFKHLSPADRNSISGILRDTKPKLWQRMFADGA